MRNVFKQNFPNITIYDALSSNLPFEDGFFQVVFIAQAFHWFSNIESLREIHRVLKPQYQCKTSKSGIGLIWNLEDCKHAVYMQELFDLCSKYDKNVPHYYTLDWEKVFKTEDSKCLFNDPIIKSLENKEIYISIPNVWNRILSKSFIATLDDAMKMDVKKHVENIVKKHKHLHVYREDEKQMCLQYPYVMVLAWSFCNK
jgi:SAM-dependent methyltransferase